MFRVLGFRPGEGTYCMGLDSYSDPEGHDGESHGKEDGNPNSMRGCGITGIVTNVRVLDVCEASVLGYLRKPSKQHWQSFLGYPVNAP